MKDYEPQETAAAPPQRQRRGGRLVERTLIITICFGILSLLNLEPLARNSVQNHNSKLFDLPQTDNDSVGIIQHFQSSKALPSKFSNDAAPSVAAVELVGSKEGGGEPVAAPPILQMSLSLHSQKGCREKMQAGPHSSILYGHVHIAKTGGTSLNGIMANTFERVCGHNGCI